MSIFSEKQKPAWRRKAEITLANIPTEARLLYGRAQVAYEETERESKRHKGRRHQRPGTLGGFGWTNTRARRRW